MCLISRYIIYIVWNTLTQVVIIDKVYFFNWRGSSSDNIIIWFCIQADFIQFTGDLINGYLTNEGEMDLQYANWKSAIAPYAHYCPVYAGMGNHEAFMRSFGDIHWTAMNAFRVDGFPYQSLSAEALFAKNFQIFLRK